ncbi:MAG: TspO/MBR family protein [Polyangiaceae bacterium]
MTRTRQALGLFGWLLLSFIAAGVGGWASAHAATFYGGLNQPVWAPPAWLFGPVWTLLYLAMGVAAWMVWRVGGFAAARTTLALFIVQLTVNALWTWLFFAWHLGALAFADIALLWVLIVITMVKFWRIRPLAGALLAPYLAWVSFASALSFAVWHLNPEILGG